MTLSVISSCLLLSVYLFPHSCMRTFFSFFLFLILVRREVVSRINNSIFLPLLMYPSFYIFFHKCLPFIFYSNFTHFILVFKFVHMWLFIIVSGLFLISIFLLFIIYVVYMPLTSFPALDQSCQKLFYLIWFFEELEFGFHNHPDSLVYFTDF